MKKISRTKAFYIDTYALESYHEMFNSSLILMCSLIFDEVDCRLSSSSFKVFKNLVNEEIPNNIHFKKVCVLTGKGRFQMLSRYLFSALQNLRYLILAPNDAVLIYPYNNLFGLRLLNFFNKICKKKILIFCHGEMEEIVTDLKTGGFLHRTLTWLCHDFFLNPKVKISKQIHFSVMGEMIKENLSQLLPEDKISKFISIDHSYIFNQVDLKDKKYLDLFCIGTVGLLNETKGMNNFIDFVSKIDPVYQQKLHISVTGKVENNVSILKDFGIDIIEQETAITRNEFDRRVEKLDLLLFFYPINSYKITASGAIMDAILKKKTILALNNDYFAYVFNKFGEFGYIKNSIDEMINQLYKLIDEKEKKTFNFKQLQGKFSPEAISKQLLTELRRIGYLNF